MKDLRKYADRIRSLEEGKAELNEEIKSVFADAADAGYEPKALRRALALLKLDGAFRATIDLYESQLTLDLERPAKEPPAKEAKPAKPARKRAAEPADVFA